ncbi:MAG: hypothetical protein KKC55_00880, partial [Gammaproteobacteria bacterium]|nr:hypothetical protein [Gammaproteobacteria bacterium]
TIIKVRAAQEGFSGAGYLFNQALVLTGGGVIIAPAADLGRAARPGHQPAQAHRRNAGTAD